MASWKALRKHSTSLSKKKNSALVQWICVAGAEALQAVIQIPDDQMVRRLTMVGSTVLQIAIRVYNDAENDISKVESKKIMKDMSKLWIVALESAMGGNQKNAVETVLNNTADLFKRSLDEADKTHGKEA